MIITKSANLLAILPEEEILKANVILQDLGNGSYKVLKNRYGDSDVVVYKREFVKLWLKD